MISRLRRFRHILKIPPLYIYSGAIGKYFNQRITCVGVHTGGRDVEGCFFHRFSAMAEAQKQLSPETDLLTFFKSTFHELDGPNHCWLNKFEESELPFRKDSTFLVLVGVFVEDLFSDHALFYESVKYLQRRYPQLAVFGFQCGSPISIHSQTQILQAIMKEYLTFPILLSNKKFSEMKNGPHYLLFKDFKSPLLYYEKGTETETISEAIEEFSSTCNENAKTIQELKGNGNKHPDGVKEPCVLPFRNLCLYYPGCISEDEDGNRLFLSDSNHHRVIICNSYGKILDCIGSSPGFEDGDFESAKLLRPAASLYDAVEDCLYLVDSELFGDMFSILDSPTSDAPRFSAMAEAQKQLSPETDLLTFFKSTFHELDGPNHCWLNKFEESELPFRKDSTFLVLVGVFVEDLFSDHALFYESVKYLQRRYPQLAVFGFQCGSPISIHSQTQILQAIMKEYLTFPILLSNKKFSEMKNGPHYLLFKDFKSPLLYYEKGTETETISEAIEEFSSTCNENAKTIQELKGNGNKHPDGVKEPCVLPFRNLCLYYPGCISEDEDGNRLFLSDSNHHRVIICNSYGKILDCIGSSPGFEDGDFESAKLLRPAASLYDAVEDCLYLVDSENHAIRRADLEKRSLQTIYPSSNTGNKFTRIWSWVMDKLERQRQVAPNSEEVHLEPLFTPWHLMKSEEDKLLIFNHSFSTLWIMDPASGKIEDVMTDYKEIIETFGDICMERAFALRQISRSKLKPEGCVDTTLISSHATFNGDIIFCDSVGQAVLKRNRETGITSHFHLSNFGILGLPYWLNLPLEKVFVGANTSQKQQCLDHLQCFSVLPGRCEIKVNIDIPEDTELAGPLQEGCIWRQARGCAAEVSEHDMDISTEKVGVAQQWFDELDNLAFIGDEPEASVDDDNRFPGTNTEEDGRVHIQSVINISPGKSEVIIYAALYLKIKKSEISHENREKNAKRMLNIKSEKQGITNAACVELLLESCRDIGEIVFMKPLHIRLEFDCQDHPKADKANDVVLTDSIIQVNVALK